MASTNMYDFSPAAVTLVCGTTGVLANFAFFCVNTAINYITMPVLLIGHSESALNPTSCDKAGAATIPHLNRQWQEVYSRGHRMGPALAVSATVAHGLAAYSANEWTVKCLFGAAAAASIAVVPYTLLVMLPTNDALHARADAKKDRDGDDEKTLGLIVKWVGMSKVRANIALLSAFLSVSGIVRLARG
ncbi:unnamed protein product [Zymoseptoria tritici ST99CH_3D1]|uniref:DUF1772 domain-containing protein n=1 Tax=Zymoseptoria tritici ST99CH_1E4 TaxID=1276532 RepID=A0A2H1GLL4_ZYMTR|nr:unnamed protein product [Zymoseptoria tritici ST99CH_1E4]SMR56370.1 unnamed protein product [Zymoseptoria tritici ST99CH_3D1]